MRILIILLVILASNSEAQTIFRASYDSGMIQIEVSDRISSDTYKVYLDGMSSVRPATCIGVKPSTCRISLPELKLGNNILEITVIRNGAESVKSNPIVIFFSFKEDSLTLRCKPGSYRMQRLTDANKLLEAVNSVSYVSNILATANAIYVFNCELAQ